MKNNIQKLIEFFSNPSNRCKGSYSRGNKLCLLGAMGDFFNTNQERALRVFLLDRLELFVANHNRKFANSKETGYINIQNLNLATFNDEVDNTTLLNFLGSCQAEA